MSGGLKLLVGFWAALHIFRGDLYNEFSATDILLGPSDLCPHVSLVERGHFDVHAFCHSCSPLMSGAIPLFGSHGDCTPHQLTRCDRIRPTSSLPKTKRRNIPQPPRPNPPLPSRFRSAPHTRRTTNPPSRTTHQPPPAPQIPPPERALNHAPRPPSFLQTQPRRRLHSRELLFVLFF